MGSVEDGQWAGQEPRFVAQRHADSTFTGIDAKHATLAQDRAVVI
jgi:hypothetical protein